MSAQVRLFLLCAVTVLSAAAQQRVDDPYACEGVARGFGQTHSLKKLREAAANLAATAKSAKDFCTLGELYKRLGDGRAREYYDKAIMAAPEEPAYELFYGDYLRVYHGAAERPLFPEAEKHLIAGLEKLSRLKQTPDPSRYWNTDTEARLRRSLAALYERDGFQLAQRPSGGQGPDAVTRQPWLFFSPAAQYQRSTDDLDRSSDVRDLTAAALFSQNSAPGPSRRLGRPLTEAELSGMARIETPLQAEGTLRVRYGAAPVLDVSFLGRRTGDAEVTNYFKPDEFNNLKLVDFGVKLEKPLAITRTTDALLRFAYHRVNRQGLIEFEPTATERLDQFEAFGALSQYVGPDRIKLSYTYVRQNIDPQLSGMLSRDREMMGGTLTYQIFRPLPLPGRDSNTASGRHFETRGVDLLAGLLKDKELYPASPAGVFIRRGDYYLGVAARGLGRIDLTLQPTWYTSRVSNDRSQNNSQLRTAGNVLIRVLDEERTPEIPKERFLGMPVAFVQVVVPFHWDTPRGGLGTFQSRSVGTQLWTKLFSDGRIGVTLLGMAGYSRDRFPVLGKDFNLVRLGLSVGF